MILTNCAACAAPLPHKAKQCSRCKTRYCGPACQKQHWDAGGHKDICRRIKKDGGAEQYNANKKYKETVAEAVEACVDDTKGQTCYICTQALHWKTKEGLVRMCACRGTAGFAHVSCLAEQAKILYAEAEENNLSNKTLNQRWDRWGTCSLCEQNHHGVVRCALGWACWKTYLGRPEADECRDLALVQLGIGLHGIEQYDDALVAFRGFLDNSRRAGMSEDQLLCGQTNVANCLWRPDQADERLRIERHVFSRCRALYGDREEDTIISALNLADTLINKVGRCDEVPPLLRSISLIAKEKYGPEHDLTIRIMWKLGLALAKSIDGDEADEGRALLFDTRQIARRVLGTAHPMTHNVQGDLYRVLPVPRFAVGTRVECRVRDAKYHKGTVVALHYRSERVFEENYERGYFAPYQVQLDSEGHGLVSGNDEGLIYAPDDHDRIIRAVASDADDNEPAPPAAPPGTFFDQGPGGATAWVPNTSDEDDAATV